MPLFSQGFRVCLSPPCTDEPRLRLDPEDIIKVTRFRKHWLFGERVVDESKEKSLKDIKKRHLRGWFPRRCAIELILPGHNYNSSGDEGEPMENIRRRPATNEATALNNGNNHRKNQNGHHRKKNN